MNKIAPLVFICIFSCGKVTAQIVTFTRSNNNTNSITIPAGEAWQIHSWYAPAGNYNDIYFSCFQGGNPDFGTSGTSIYLGGTSSQFFSVDSPSSPGSAYHPIGFIVSGPALFKAGPQAIGSGGNGTNYGYTLVFKKIISRDSSNLISASSVVIPTSAAGDVDVKMEQSADNVTWTECLPGTYNSSTVKRFFRLRAVEK